MTLGLSLSFDVVTAIFLAYKFPNIPHYSMVQYSAKCCHLVWLGVWCIKYINVTCLSSFMKCLVLSY